MKNAITVVSLIFFLSISMPAFCAPEKKQPGTRLLTPVTTLMQKLNQGDHIFLVDIRPAKEFSQFKIPGSLNVKAPLIKTKAFLKTRPIVLIHQGFANREMAAVAKGLNTRDFSVSVLQGGLAAWTHKGGQLVGNPFSFKTVHTISAREFFAGSTREDWVILNLSPQPSDKKAVPAAIPLAMEKSEDNVSSRIGQILSTKQMSDTTSIIIFNESGSDYTEISGRFPVHYRDRVFGLTGGLNAYQDFHNTRMLANRPKSERIRETGDCAPCTDGSTD